MTRPVITVLGATGAQGGGTALALLESHRQYAVRAVTRRPDSPAARALAEAGAEIAVADLDDRASLERAFAGTRGVFAVTNFWEHGSAERELAQAANIAAAAKAARVAHVVWSTLEDTRLQVPLHDERLPTLQGRWKTPHYDAKGEADRFFAESGVPTTFLRTSFYWENFIHLGMGPQRDARGELALTLPIGAAALPGIAAADIGPCAAALFARRDWVIGATIGIAGAHLTGAQMAAAMGRAIGEPVRFAPMTRAAYAALGFPGADDLANMFEYKRLFEASYCGARPIEATRFLHPGLQDFEAWLERSVGQLPVPARRQRA